MNQCIFPYRKAKTCEMGRKTPVMVMLIHTDRPTCQAYLLRQTIHTRIHAMPRFNNIEAAVFHQKLTLERI